MESPSITHLTATEVAQLDPYAFLALLGKRVIHPGGRRSSEELFRRAFSRTNRSWMWAVASVRLPWPSPAASGRR